MEACFLLPFVFKAGKSTPLLWCKNVKSDKIVS